MRFYKLTGIVVNDIWDEERRPRRIDSELTRCFGVNSERFFDKINRKGYFFVSKINEKNSSLECGIIDAELTGMERCIDRFLEAMELEVENRDIEEVTMRTLRGMLHLANRNGYIDDDDEILEKFELSSLSRGNGYGENIIPDSSEEEVRNLAKEWLIEESATPEFDRIYSMKNSRQIAGHPVHYVLETDDKDVRREGARLLLKALYSAGRVKNRRYCFMDVEHDDDLSDYAMEVLYKSNAGGALIIRFAPNDTSDGEYASSVVRNIEVLSEVMIRHRNQVLTIFCLPRECTGLKHMLYENLPNISMVEIREEMASGERAMDYLKMLAKKNRIRPDKNLFGKLEEGKGYLGPELNEMFNEWYDLKLKTSIYPQYKAVQAVKHEVAKEKPKGSAYDDLMGLIGLSDAKKVINNALDYYKAQKVFADKGMKSENASMHMVFTGNPGSAKTTVARLFAQIMRDNNLLSKGHLVEVGRGDLVGQFVGWTAKIVQRKFREAEGGVLFIDEAYSLVDDKDGLFGDEAINTIVQEMENRRDSVVVIFAGYPDKMEKFLQKNPGLRSRIAFHVPFADYNPDELVEIADLMSSKKGIILEDDAKKKMRSIFEEVSAEPEFGNGRYVRNMLEKARMAQASRLLKMDLDSVTKDDILTIKAADIEMPDISRSAKKPIGFSAA